MNLAQFTSDNDFAPVALPMIIEATTICGRLIWSAHSAQFAELRNSGLARQEMDILVTGSVIKA